MQLKPMAVCSDMILSALASIMPDFLEAIEQMDQDVVDIIEAHYTTINVIEKRK